MSAEAMAAVYAHARVKLHLLPCLQAIAWFHNAKEEPSAFISWPSQRTLANHLGMADLRQLKRHIATLRALGLIKTEKRGRRNRYTICLPSATPRDLAALRAPIQPTHEPRERRRSQEPADPPVPALQSLPTLKPANHVWWRMRSQLECEMSEAQADSWLRTVQAFWMADGVLLLMTHSTYAAEILHMRYGDRIVAAAERAAGVGVDVEIRASGATDRAPRAAVEAYS